MNADDVPDYDDPEVERAWAEAQRATVREYLAAQRVVVSGIPRQPEWVVAPFLAVWVVQMQHGGAVWVISGDLPTDYLHHHEAASAREAVRAFGQRWERVASSMLAGRSDPEVSIGRPEDRPQLGDLLWRRAELLKDFAKRDEFWEE